MAIEVVSLEFQISEKTLLEIPSVTIVIRSCNYPTNSLCILGNWWAVRNFGEITGTIAIEMDKGAYIHALDNGLFTLGAPHKGLLQEMWK